ncbi:glutamate racemase [Apilactobacillus micheneri]|uniref:glutamate racemase n=1 Tax=Apilactobacillus micheneri TaxID=1899430 RepID=UPI001127BC49|nr:glutamate racemase [Apilactobacillus micheneri]TPR38678.1 glutamate racemase [Apilactobacillus micheneri]
MDKRAIGFMDSGVGGLTVAKEAIKQFPNENIIYFGDEARLPYGEKSPEEIKKFAQQIADFLIDKGIKILVIACNTATAHALSLLKDTLDIPVIGVIYPGSLAAVNISKEKRIGVIATNGTIKSKAYEKTISSINNDVKIFSLGCPRFIPMVEDGHYKSQEDQKLVTQDLMPIIKDNVDTLVMGCTHYPIMRKLIQNAVGADVRLVDPGIAVIKDIKQTIDELNLKNSLSHTKTLNFYTTGSIEKFRFVAEEWLDRDIDIKKVSLKTLEEY